MSLTKFYFGDDFLNQFFGEALSSSLPAFQVRSVYDTQKYDLVPKPEFVDAEIKKVDEEIADNERLAKMAEKYYEGVRKNLAEKREKLVSQKGKKR